MSFGPGWATGDGGALPAALAANPCGAALALVDAYLRPEAGAVALGGGWRLTIDAPGFPAVRELVPQRPPMLLLGAVIARDGRHADVHGDGRGGLAAGRRRRAAGGGAARGDGAGGRGAARAAGARRGEPVRVGLLLGARDLALHVPRVRVGAHLVVRATQVFGMDAIAEFHCRVEANGACLAEGTLHVVRGDLEAQPA
jgi:predicted hotdog family 3-hydroxylacyl-ACP dehydratase